MEIQRDKSGIFLIDKPSGWTSFDVVAYMRRQLGIRKIGHAGTLDPLATGLLILAVGPATKTIDSYMHLPKEYEVEIEFGKTSTTYDAEGQLTPCAGLTLFPLAPDATSAPALSDFAAARVLPVLRDNFEKILPEFTGEISQMPPAFSAIKVNGKRAYKLAREGKPVELAARTVMIHSLEILTYEWPFVSLRVACSKGTYIRSLAHDLGQKLGCGGYVKNLRRTKIGDFSVEDAKKIEKPALRAN